MFQGVGCKGKREVMPMQYQSSKRKQGSRSLQSAMLHGAQHNKKDAVKMLIRTVHTSPSQKNKLMLTESELRICLFCITQSISRGKVLENLF